ncbi:MAG TPA: hypothetical protein VN745_03890 [Verrucomicrobiae bacterium]|nr:hypothetical protein [Verrucomicrobiae bacterium]
MKRFHFLILITACAAIFALAGGNALGATRQEQGAKQQNSQTSQQAAPKAQDVPKIDGGVGACRADFTVRDGEKKPIYNAQISVELRYGFMNMRKTDLQIGTNSDGKARFTGLPNFPKKPLAFHIKSGTVSKTVTDDPETNCNAVYDVVLTVH